jgi:hypothetical protein
MTSSSENERSLESDNFRSGIFSKWLNDGLRGFANWDDEFVDHWELGDYVYKRVKDYVKENHHATQVPVIMRGRSPFNLTKPGLVRLAGR